MSDTRFKIHDSRYGFTLIELLIAITVIGILSTIGFTTFRSSQQQAKDTQRKNDIRQYQLALENYASSNNSFYPSRTTAGGVSTKTTLCTDLGSFISSCPEDPANAGDETFTYLYQSDGAGGGAVGAIKWVLWGKIERKPNYWVACSNGKSGEKAQQGFSVSGGACPL